MFKWWSPSVQSILASNWDTVCVSLSLFSVISIIPSLSEYLMPARPSPKFCQRLCQKPLSFTAPASHFVPGTALKRNFLWFQMKASLSSNGEQGAALTSLHLGFQLRRNYPKTLYSSQLPPPSTPHPPPGSSFAIPFEVCARPPEKSPRRQWLKG